MIKGGATFRIVTDPIGSPRLVVDVATGTIAQRMNATTSSATSPSTPIPDSSRFGFAGGLYDPAAKLVRLGLRDYDAATGRFTAPRIPRSSPRRGSALRRERSREPGRSARAGSETAGTTG